MNVARSQTTVSCRNALRCGSCSSVAAFTSWVPRVHNCMFDLEAVRYQQRTLPIASYLSVDVCIIVCCMLKDLSSRIYMANLSQQGAECTCMCNHVLCTSAVMPRTASSLNGSRQGDTPKPVPY
jgi:hypothetical protein